MKKWFFKLYAWGCGKTFHEYWVYRSNGGKGKDLIHCRAPRDNMGKLVRKHYELTHK